MSNQKLRHSVQALYIVLAFIGIIVSLEITSFLIMATMIIGGTFYCGWLCPFGSLQEVTTNIAKKLGIKQVKMPKVLQKYLKFSRYIIAVLMMVITADFIFTLMSYNPEKSLLALLDGQTASVIGLIVIATTLAISIKFERFFCNYMCFEGAKYGLIGSISFVTIQRTDSCVDCKKCDKACPMQIEVSKCNQMTNPQCINCFKCMDVCPVDSALTYKTRAKKYWLVYAGVIGVVLVALVFLQPLISERIEAETLDEEPITTETNSVIEEEIIVEEDVTVEETAVEESPGIQNDMTEGIDQGDLENGTFTGIGNGFRGNIYVEVTVENGYIEDITVTDHSDDRKWYNRATAIIDDIINEQSTDVDLIGGATYSSQGIRDAVKDALNID